MIWFVINQHAKLVLSDDSVNNDIYSNQLTNGNIHVINGTVTSNFIGFSGSGGDGGRMNYLVDDDIRQNNHFTSTWAVRVPGGEADADQVANEHGFANHGKVSASPFLCQSKIEKKKKKTQH